MITSDPGVTDYLPLTYPISDLKEKEKEGKLNEGEQEKLVLIGNTNKGKEGKMVLGKDVRIERGEWVLNKVT